MVSTARTSEISRPRKPIFMGWKVVGASSVVWALQSLVWVQGYGNLAVELRRQFGWSKTFFSVVFAATRAEIALMGPAQGKAIAQRGITTVMRVGAVFTFLGFLAVSQVSGTTAFFIAMLFLAVGMSLVGFLTISSSTVKWFERKRARALSIQTMGFALGGFAAPVIVAGYNLIGWRWTTALSGAVLAAVAWWGAGISGRDRVEMGEHVDGIEHPEDLPPLARAEGVSDQHFTASEAFRTRAFWMISFGHGSALVVVSASMAHLALYLTEDRSFSAGRAALIAGLVPMFQLIGTVLGGSLGDRFNKRLIAGVAMWVHGVGLLLLTWVEHSAAIGAFVVMHGLAWGIRGPLMQAIRADYFGSTDYARILGWSSIIMTIGAMAGPLLAGLLADSTGNYRLGFTLVAGLAIFGTVFWILASPPAPPIRSASE